MRNTRQKPEAARREIIETAHRYLVEGGPDAVKVQRIAKDLDISDAAIHYHFKNRQGLLEALLRHAGADLKRKLEDIEEISVDGISQELRSVYEAQGYARLAMWLSISGREDEGRGMFGSLVRRWKAAHKGKSLTDARYEIAFLNLIAAGEPLMSGAFLRSVGLPGDEESRSKFRRWYLKKLSELI